ncbi:MAG TPA: SDR family NAD(P)-dependent oxidoreductase [Solirubrobacteraceae bacterium]|jgi:short-subunit dehydrogenase|nr:SDR family NAD(P)-dependent oxidoreductase [Solirubrobacteraceae bacterium]
MQISGSTVLLTGATGGIGHAIARSLHERGAKLILTGRRGDVLAPLAAELGARALSVDLSSAVELDRMVGEVGPVDILVANAALPGSGRLDSYSTEELDRALAVNLRAPMVLTQALTPGMLERGSGHLVFISSLAGKAATAGSSIYNATKFGLRGFAIAMRSELRDGGVGVSTIYPGFIREAGMFAEAKVKLPVGVGTRSPGDVAGAVISGIEHNRGELDVAPLMMRASTLIGALAPELAGHLARRLGSAQIANDMEAAQLAKR